jgi:glycosyltransferase involved in cell wall biosynthesis
MIDIINTYAAAGYCCILMTGRLNVRNIPLHPTVRIEKIIKYDRSTTFKRLGTWIIGFFQIGIKVLTKHRHDHLFIVSNPPFAPLMPALLKNSFQLLIYDIYPDALFERGYFRENSLLIKYWKKANRKVFNKAKGIFTISDSMKEVLQKYAGETKIQMIPIWTDNGFLKPIDPARNHFIRNHNLSGKFIVMYSGSIGLSGDVEVLITVANEIERDDILFLIIGEGSKKEKIREKVKSLKLENVILLPWQPVTEIPFSFSSADLAVISLGINDSKLAIPSKLYNFLSVGAPLLCISSRGSEIDNLATRYQCGRNFEPVEIKEIKEFILEIAANRDLHSLMRMKSLEASKYYTSANARQFLKNT